MVTLTVSPSFKSDVDTKSGIHPFLDNIKYTVSQPSSGSPSVLIPPKPIKRLAGISCVTLASKVVIILPPAFLLQQFEQSFQVIEYPNRYKLQHVIKSRCSVLNLDPIRPGHHTR